MLGALLWACWIAAVPALGGQRPEASSAVGFQSERDGGVLVQAREPDQAESSPGSTAATFGDGIDDEPRYFDIHWQRGLTYRVRDVVQLPWRSEEAERLKGRFGVKLQVDAAAFAQRGGSREANDGVEMRRSYLYTTGDFFLITPISFKVQMGFLDGFDVDEFYLRFKHLPHMPILTIGQFDAPVALDRLTSSYDTTFMERAAPVEAFVPGRRAGVQAADTARDQRVTWAVGWFTPGQREATTAATKDVSRLDGRVTWCEPMSGETDPHHVFHLGFSGDWVLTRGSGVRYKSRPESFLAPTLVDTGTIDATNAFLVGVEAATVLGPVSLQTEYFNSPVRARDSGTRDFSGLYVAGSVFLTGESRPYDRAKGVFGHVTPKQDFSLRQRHLGALEWGARYSYLDLNDGPVKGGTMHVITSGSSWYFNDFLRLQLEYSFATVSGGPAGGRLHTVQARLQFVL